MKKYDYLLIGSGLFNATLAKLIKKNNKDAKVLVVERRGHIAGNIYDEKVEGITVHKYGAHIFHTNDIEVWKFLNEITEFNRFTNSPIANYKGEIYNLPFNMNTFVRMWGISTIQEAKDIIENQRKEIKHEPRNLEEQAISLVGRDIYEKLIKGYTEKQWGRDCKALPAFIINRIPVRVTYDNNYFNDIKQGIPIIGYTKMVEKMFDGCDIELNEDYLKNRDKYDATVKVFNGGIDEYYDF
ncbi:MAG: NAD(P)-binding protein [Lachnospiraceae bacterium]|nr:NAD(P)-binding protein [Lachnospiraceae bacterium]